MMPKFSSPRAWIWEIGKHHGAIIAAMTAKWPESSSRIARGRIMNYCEPKDWQLTHPRLKL